MIRAMVADHHANDTDGGDQSISDPGRVSDVEPGLPQHPTRHEPSGDLEKIVEDLAENWQLLGAQDPLWAILSDPAKRGGGWRIDQFLETGRLEAEQIMGHLAELSLSPECHRVLDFGCGVGRITHALAGYFERADGLDVSEAMVVQARRLHQDLPNLFFHQSVSPELPFPGQSFDVIYSRLVLQHMATDIALNYVAEFVRVLRPLGVAIVQAPSRCLIDEEVMASEVQFKGGSAMIEMHAHPREMIEGVIRERGGRIADVRDDPCAGEFFESLKYTFIR